MLEIFKKEKKEEAIEKIAHSIVLASKNCTYVIRKISTLSQNPEGFPSASKMVDEWLKYLFTNNFHDIAEDWTAKKLLNLEDIINLETLYFNYLISIVPFYYENKIIISPKLKSEKYKWNNDDYMILKKKIFFKRYEEYWDKSRIDNPQEFEFINQQSLNSLNLMNQSSKIRKSFWNKESKIKGVYSINHIDNFIYQIMPNFEHQYQSDLFLKYSNEFNSKICISLDEFDSDFYMTGTYLHKYFSWS